MNNCYDGTTPLQPLVAELVGCSPKNQSKIAKVTKQAKEALGITSKARRLPCETKVRIYEHLVELYSQPNKDVEIVSQSNDNESVNIDSQTVVEIDSHSVSAVNINSHTPDFDNVRIAFYTTHNDTRKREVIALDGFFINALASIGVSREGTTQWVQSQVNTWTAFDAQLPITRQVKFLIIRAVSEFASKWQQHNG